MNFLCLTPQALDALGDPDQPVEERRLLHAPVGVGVRPDVAPPPDARAVYGTVYANHLETEHFTLNWEEGVADDEIAARTGERLEAAWSTLVTEQGWTPPVSSDQYYLWVLLVNDLGATGFTTEYVTDDYPDGYPVVFLDTAWASDAPFWSTLVTHEFHHAAQFAVRQPAGGTEETWFWEASASWASLLVEPDSTALDYTVPWYAEQPDLSYDSGVGWHPYGMMVFNAWLDTVGVGPGAMLAAWAEGEAQPGASWRTILEASTGRSAGDLWSSFGRDFGNDTFGRTAAWADPAVTALAVGEQVHGSAEELGTAYYRGESDVWIDPHWVAGEGSAEVRFPGQTGSRPWWVPAGTVVSITTTEGESVVWSITVTDGPPTGDTGDTGGAVDSGDTPPSNQDDPPKPGAPACACAAGTKEPPPAGLALGIGLLCLTRRAKPVASR